MKFTVAWSQVLSQNVTLRLTIFCLSATVVGLLVVLTKLTLRDPIVIERACFSRALEKASVDRTETEIEAFIKEALSQRFDSNIAAQDGLLSTDESRFREQEQKALREKEMKQKVLLDKIQKISAGEITVDSDRILTVGPVRSTLPFPLKLTVSSVTRSNGNPYGLRLMQIKVLDKISENEKKNDK